MELIGKEINEGFSKVKGDILTEVKTITAEQKKANDEQFKALRAESDARDKRARELYAKTRDSFVRDGMCWMKDKWVSINDFFKSAAGRVTKTFSPVEFRNYQNEKRSELGMEVKGASDQLLEGTTTSGGYLVPDELDAMILQLLTEPDIITSKVQRITTGRDNLIINRETTAPAGGFISEASSIKTGTTNPVFGQTTIEVYKWAFGIKVTNELLSDALANVGQYISNRVTQVMAYDMMKYIISGSGSSQPTGIIQATPATKRNYATLAYTDLLAAYFGITEPYIRNAFWLTTRALMPTILYLQDAGNHLIFQGMATDAPPRNILGLGVIANSNSTANAIWLVDGDGYIMADRGITEFGVFRETYADTDEVYFRFIRRWGGEMVRTAGLYEVVKT
jgi:HK97 family phage major capsid protein